MRVVPVVPRDIERVAALAAEVWRDHYRDIITSAQIDYMLGQRYDPAVLHVELERSDVWWEQALADGELVGFSSFLLTGEAATMKLDKLYVRTACQRRGVGGLLIARALDAARREGCRRLILAVNKRNVLAIAAYRKYGFRVVDAVVKDIGGGFVMDDYVMEKSAMENG